VEKDLCHGESQNISAKRTEVNGHVFPSKKEATRYMELFLLQKAGEIKDLELQPKFAIVVNGFKVCTYIADFRYRNRYGDVIVEDVKGFRTPVYSLKAKLMKAVHGITILET
jgi:hypothetical protein